LIVMLIVDLQTHSRVVSGCSDAVLLLLIGAVPQKADGGGSTPQSAAFHHSMPSPCRAHHAATLGLRGQPARKGSRRRPCSQSYRCRRIAGAVDEWSVCWPAAQDGSSVNSSPGQHGKVTDEIRISLCPERTRAISDGLGVWDSRREDVKETPVPVAPGRAFPLSLEALLFCLCLCLPLFFLPSPRFSSVLSVFTVSSPARTSPLPPQPSRLPSSYRPAHRQTKTRDCPRSWSVRLGNNPALAFPAVKSALSPSQQPRTTATMSEGNVKPPTNPVVAEAHEVDTFRESRNEEASASSRLTSSRSATEDVPQ
jgi:hypothetical protein